MVEETERGARTGRRPNPVGAVDAARPGAEGPVATVARATEPPSPRHLPFESASLRAGPLPALAFIAVVAFGAWHVLTNIVLLEPGLWQNAIHFAGFALLAALTTPMLARWHGSRAALMADIAFGLLVAAAALWIAHAESGIYERTLAQTGVPWQFRPVDWAAGLIVILGAIELTRRLTGWIIPVLILVSLATILGLGAVLPGVFRTASLPASDVLFRSLYNDEGMFGTITTISSANIALFMVFGAFLVRSGASDFVIEAAKGVAGRFRGGAAFVAVIASALTGTISGSAVANTASTGVITIPLMKGNGFRPQFAGGVEAAASTGGQIMPPIMGAGAFVMVSYTGVPYGTIVAYSIVPALLYFLTVAFTVRVEAVRGGIEAGTAATIDRAKLRGGALVFAVPLVVLTWLLVSGFTPAYAACSAIATLIATSWLTPNRMGPRAIAEALASGMRTAVMVSVLLVAVGLVNNAVVTSGLANAFALMIAEWSQGSLVLALVLVALASLVLGMGLPVTAAYIVLAILSAPALAGLLADAVIVERLVEGIADPVAAASFMLIDHPMAMSVAGGMTPAEAGSLMDAVPFEIAVVLRPALVDAAQMTAFVLTAHLIVFWLSQDSNVTPPVCLAAFTAAGIAGASPMGTGFQAWRIAKGLYLVPVLFAISPLVGGTWGEVAWVGAFAAFGAYAMAACFAAHAEGPLGALTWPLMALAAVACLWPLHVPLNAGGAGAVIALTWWSRRAGRARQGAV